MSQLAKALQDILADPRLTKFVDSLSHSDLPKGWQKDNEIVDMAGTLYKEMGTESPFFKAYTKATPKVEQPSYMAGHRPSDPFYSAPSHDLTKLYPKDVYTKQGLDYYGNYEDFADTSHKILQGLEGNPNKEVKAFRAVPKGLQENLNAGDWITFSEDYARQHGSHVLNDDYDIIEQVIKANEAFSPADSFNELGYYPQGVDPEIGKSVYNRGTFDPQDPNIYRALPWLVGGGVGAGALLGGSEEAEAMPFKPSLFDEAQNFVSSAMKNWDNNVRLPQDMTRQDYEYLADKKVASIGKDLTSELDNFLSKQYADEDELYQAFDSIFMDNYSPYLLQSDMIQDEADDLQEALEYLSKLRGDISNNRYDVGTDEMDYIIEGLKNNSSADFTNEAKDMLVPFLEKLGLGVDFNTSNKSNSMYFDVFDNSGNRKKIRFSDHDLPNFYDESDYDIRFASRADDVLYEFGNAIDDMFSNSNNGVKIFDEIEIPDEIPKGTNNKMLPLAVGGGALAATLSPEDSYAQSLGYKNAQEWANSQGVKEALWSPADLAVAPIGAAGASAKALAMALDLPITYSFDKLLSAIIGD